MIWITRRDYSPAALGFIPQFLDESDPRPAREQLDANYSHGGGWVPIEGFTLDPSHETLRYPGDPPYRAVAGTTLRNETVVVFERSWVAVIQPGGSFEVARMD